MITGRTRCALLSLNWIAFLLVKQGGWGVQVREKGALIKAAKYTGFIYRQIQVYICVYKYLYSIRVGACVRVLLSYAITMTSQLFVLLPTGKNEKSKKTFTPFTLPQLHTHTHTYIYIHTYHKHTYINSFLIWFCSFKRSCPTWMTRNSCLTRSNQYATPRAPSRNMEAPAAIAWGTMRSSSDTRWRRQIRCKEFHLNTEPR